MSWFLGIDGGGTKTDFLLIDAGGNALAHRREGSAYYLETGVEALRRMLVEGIRQTLATAGLAPEDVSYAFLGLPAYGENRSMLHSLDHIADDVFPTSRYSCANDVQCGWAGSLAGVDGITIVAGTGSIAYGQLAAHSARAGGWGELFGDEGSAFWIAREALTLFSRMSDGRTPAGPLHALIRQHFRVESDLEVCAAVYGPPALGRREFAGLSRLASEAARNGDAQTMEIFSRAARELAAVVHAVRDRLQAPPEIRIPVSWCGGVLQSDGLLLPLFESALASSGRPYAPAPPRLLPCAGAALYAATLAGAPLSSQAIDKLARTHAATATSDQTRVPR